MTQAPTPQKLILSNHQSPGDIIMLTSTVRDLQKSHPGKYLVDVRTPYPQLWENNPYITKLDDNDPEARKIPMHYPLIENSNNLQFHFIHGFRLYLEEQLNIKIIPTAFKGDIHLTNQEKAWMSQVDEIAQQQHTKFWIIVSGGKKDFTAKWWDPERSQQVVDHFKDRILFVQCGAKDHVHPGLNNVIDLRGKTDLRQMARLMYHASGVICPVTMFMHLAAAIEYKPGQPMNRPCVVVAGGREPTHWEAYPHHQFLHTLGMLKCCENGGCWKSRVVALNDGDRDKDGRLCLQPVKLASGQMLPRCLDMITAQDVIRAVEGYLEFKQPG